MRTRYLLVCMAFLSLATSAQDWQSCRPEGDYSFNELKEAVHRVTSSQGYFGVDEKIFNRSGDLVAVALLKALDDREMASPEHANFVLLILRMAFGCPQRCVQVTDDRRPRMTLLLLDRLNEITRRKMHTEIEETRQFILEQAGKAN